MQSGVKGVPVEIRKKGTKEERGLTADDADDADVREKQERAEIAERDASGPGETRNETLPV